MNDETKALALEHARAEMPREACGLIVVQNGKERYWPCRNIAQNQQHFIMEAEDFAKAEDHGDVIGVFHSHPNGLPQPSEADKVGCELSGLPWHIVGLPSELWSYLEPSGYRAPLVGRPFVYGVLDCYTLVRDWYKETLNIELKDFDRGEEEWWLKGGNLYMDHFPEAGFEKVDLEKDEIKKGDLIMMQIASPVVNHAAVYLGNDVMLHHVMNRLSCRQVYGGWWRLNTRLVIRYRGAT